MPIATLLLREESTLSLTTLVAKSLDNQHLPILPIYELHINSNCYQLVLILTNPSVLNHHPNSNNNNNNNHNNSIQQKTINNNNNNRDDEGFESDMDSLSLVSNDSETTTTVTKTVKTIETDSANGSSDSDTEKDTSSPLPPPPPSPPLPPPPHETYNLVDCCCYTDAKCPDLLVFVIGTTKRDTFVFKFTQLHALRNFYTHFIAIKALLLNSNCSEKDDNGPKSSSIGKFNLLQRTDQNGVTHIEIKKYHLQPTELLVQNSTTTNNNNNNNSSSSSSIISLNTPDGVLDRKIWNSTEDLHVVKKEKKKPPEPPHDCNVISGQYVRIQVEPHPRKFTGSNNNNNNNNMNWMNSVPRLIKVRSRSETRFTTNTNCRPPMAYRYIDTMDDCAAVPITLMSSQHKCPNINHKEYYCTTASTINKRLFGLSPKLRDFTIGTNVTTTLDGCSQTNCSNNSTSSHLKSVIKTNREEKRKKNEKKVTFSAYTTVQVV